MIAIAALAFFVAMRLSVRGVLPSPLSGIAVTITFLAVVVTAFRALRSTGAISSRPLHRRHGFWLVVIGALLTLPMLGAFSLVDPWETHYAEVAREMIERHDPLSPWWANEGWFRSKPVLTFWLEAASMLVFGVRTHADEVLANGAHPEWAVRFPAAFCAIVGAYLLYYGISRTCSRRAGFTSGVILWTMPGFALLSHQAITDMPLVASIAAALGLSLRAIHTNDAKRAPPIARYALASVVAIGSFVQIAMLILDRALRTGSPGNCGLPGQPACASMKWAHPAMHGWLIALCFAPIALWAVSMILEEQRSARLFAIAAWVAASIGAMAKGPAGLAIPAAAILLAVIRSPRTLLRLEIPAGLAIAALFIMPWYVAGHARHGRAFFDEVVMRHMFGRTLDHLHDTNDGADTGIGYYVLQLGYATFPWSGLLAAAALSFPLRFDRSRHGSTRTLFYAATLVAFVLVSAMRTKFHHYVLIALPGAAAMIGLWLDERLADHAGAKRFHASIPALVGAIAVTALVAKDIVKKPALFMHLFTYRYDRKWIHTESFHTAFLVLAIAMMCALLLFSVRRHAALAVIPVVSSLVLLDAYLPRTASDGGQGKILATYYRERQSPDPLLAYQLNWKGENFYTGNHVAIFIRSGEPMKKWLETHHTVYAVAETGRVPNLERELGRKVERLTTEADSAEFALVRF